ncbi:hypothetical protein CYMTET_40544 [Cymbomonas tetramitiformis]|uniref:Fe2OG dioxygenase domain-containing protein n=1 Tax=Cymbomonas tetramitiformis TaxID=36881 RepID=A0AAE0F349_9CHLO|nr:hypothetical protein CYMTET_40544 [Cymbomonas tetramitiformis]
MGASGTKTASTHAGIENIRKPSENTDAPQRFWVNTGDAGKFAFTLDGVLSQQECSSLVSRSESVGYEQALLNVGFGKQVLDTDTRKSSRCIIDDVDLAQKLFERVREFLPSSWKGKDIQGLNERLRFLRYAPGDYFAPHFDGCYIRPQGHPRALDQSILTIQFYLNGDFSGGETNFFNRQDALTAAVRPEPGKVLVFQHDILHEGALLSDGTKYVIRTDVMYGT